MMQKSLPPKVTAVFKSYPKKMREKLLSLRELIFKVAKETKEVGELEETLKWGEPAYLPKTPKIGTTVRIDSKKSNPSQYAIYFHCQTNLIENFKTLFPDKFKFEGNRAIVFDEGDRIPLKELSICFAEALTYHLSKK